MTRDEERPTGTCIVLVAPGGERTMLPDPGANDALVGRGAARVRSGDVLHVSGYALLRPGSRAAALAAIERARDAGMRISVDPASAAPLANDPVFLDRIKPIDLLFPNRDEAAVLGPQIDVPELVITQGADGATWTDGIETVSERAIPLDDVVDTTGAGDAFAAGFLSAWPGPPQAALAAGARLAARAVTQRGGVRRRSTMPEAVIVDAKRNPGVDFAQTVDIMMGCGFGLGEAGYNVGRNAALLAGIDHHVPATTVNRFCASSLPASRPCRGSRRTRRSTRTRTSRSRR